MKLLWTFILILSTPLSTHASKVFNEQVLFLAQKGQIDQALKVYEGLKHSSGGHQYEILQKIALQILEEGARSSDPHIQLLTLLASAIASSDRANSILFKGAGSEHPEIQLATLQIAENLPNSLGTHIATRMTSSPFLLIRLEALFYLAKLQHPIALGQIEGLMAKLPPEVKPLFPQFFGVMGTPKATKMLRKLLNDPSEEVRIAAILSSIENGRDDLLPAIRTLIKHPNPKQQEAAATALGILKDGKGVPHLEKLLNSKVDTVRIAAAASLVHLGRENALTLLQDYARDGDPFAISALGQLAGNEELLLSLLNSPSATTRANAALALLQKRDPRCVHALKEIILPGPKDTGLAAIVSPGLSLKAWKQIPSFHSVFRGNPAAIEAARGLKEEILRQSRNLPEEAFLSLSRTILEAKYTVVIPTLMPLLENLGSPDAISLLKQQQEKVGAPLIRHYATLALYKLGESGSYESQLRSWLRDMAQIDCIQIRSQMGEKPNFRKSPYLLTPEENSQLFLASIETLAQRHDEEGIELLLELLSKGNPNNRYALAGLLIRATQ